jgi:hypothetical protein
VSDEEPRDETRAREWVERGKLQRRGGGVAARRVTSQAPAARPHLGCASLPPLRAGGAALPALNSPSAPAPQALHLSWVP